MVAETDHVRRFHAVDSLQTAWQSLARIISRILHACSVDKYLAFDCNVQSGPSCFVWHVLCADVCSACVPCKRDMTVLLVAADECTASSCNVWHVWVVSGGLCCLSTAFG